MTSGTKTFHRNLREENLCPYGQSLESEEFTDATLVTGDGSRFGVHRVILSAHSDLCAGIFRSERSKNHPVLVLHGIFDGNELKSLLKFIYFGKVSISADEFESFLRVARILGVRELLTTSPPPPPSTPTDLSSSSPPSLSSSLPPPPSSSSSLPLPSSSPPLPPPLPPFKRSRSGTPIKIEPENSPPSSNDEEVRPKPTPEIPPKPESSNELVVLFSEKGRCHFCHLLCRDSETLRDHLRGTHQPNRHSLCENCENFFHVCAIQRHRIKCTERYQSDKK